MNKLSIFISALLLLSFTFLLDTGCANIIPPEGGPRDSLAPLLVEAAPKDSMLNFKGNTITLSFNEYVQLDNNLQSNLVVSPNPAMQPLVTAKLRTVTIRLKDSLQPNTTYAINLGNALKDVNEGNIARNFTYVFSTGNALALDSIRGKVLLAETGGVDSTLIVVLHKNLNDTSVEKNRPDYFTRLDGKGNFVFHFLEKTSFNIFVLPDDYSKKYDDSTKLFAFFDTIITAGTDVRPVSLFAYQQQKPQQKTVQSSQAIPTSRDRNKPQVAKVLIYKSSLDGGRQDLLSPFTLQFDTKITQFDSSKLQFTDTNYNVLTGYSFVQDTSLTKFSMQYSWKEDQQFKLIMQQDAFKDSAGTMISKADTLTFLTKNESEYGSIRLRFSNLNQDRNPVLLFLQSSTIINAIPLDGSELYRKLFRPGEYELRILYDDNDNGVWDPGVYQIKKQPEIVTQIPVKVNVKPNWDNEFNISLQ